MGDRAGVLDSLPSGIHSCRENGESYIFVFDGPVFAQPVDIEMG